MEPTEPLTPPLPHNSEVDQSLDLHDELQSSTDNLKGMFQSWADDGVFGRKQRDDINEFFNSQIKK